MKNKNPTLSPKPSRKTRTKSKTRRHNKFISLRRELSQANKPDSGKMTHNHHQLNLFPLHPENHFEEKEDNNNMYPYSFFEADESGQTSLIGLLREEGCCGGGSGGVVLFSDDDDEEEDSFSPTLTYACGGQDGEEGTSCLEKSALRNYKKRKDTDCVEKEEKWVCYSEVVEKKEEEVTSCISDYWNQNNSQGLSLKLDYQEIMDAWSDKGPLYIQESIECPQIVPDVLDDSLPQDCSNVLVEEVGNLRKVPQMMVLEDRISLVEEARKMMGQREARVLRYKEKRRSRLFSKTIRYQVRKLNAEKRPRMKGRFVKRS